MQRAALRTIVVADAVMSVDNVLATGGAASGGAASGGAASGGIVPTMLGLAFSVPLIVWGSHLLSAWSIAARPSSRWGETCWRGPAIR